MPRSRGWLLEDPTSGNRTFCRTTQTGEPSVGCEKILRPQHHNIWVPNSQDCNPLRCYLWGKVKWQANKIPCNNKKELKARITAEFTNLNKETVEHTWMRFRNRQEVVIEVDQWFLSIFSLKHSQDILSNVIFSFWDLIEKLRIF